MSHTALASRLLTNSRYVLRLSVPGFQFCGCQEKRLQRVPSGVSMLSAFCGIFPPAKVRSSSVQNMSGRPLGYERGDFTNSLVELLLYPAGTKYFCITTLAQPSASVSSISTPLPRSSATSSTSCGGSMLTRQTSQEERRDNAHRS